MMQDTPFRRQRQGDDDRGGRFTFRALGTGRPAELWSRNLCGEAVATRASLTWALARVQLAGEPVNITSVVRFLPTRRGGALREDGDQ